MDLTSTIFSVKADLNLIYEKFLNLTDENFYDNLEQIKISAAQVNKNKEDLKFQLSSEELKKINDDLDEMTKKIKICFDNIVEEKEKEIEKVSFELKKLTNQKKLALYKR